MAVQKIDAIDRFLNQYKSLELYLRMAYGDGMTVLGYEEKLDTEQGDKLRICRVTRNFLQHNPSAYGFVVPTEAMIVFLEELVTDLVVKLEKSEPTVYRLPPVKLTGTMRDAGKVFVKTGMSWIPVVDGKSYVVAVLTRDKLIELMAGTGRWEDSLEALFRPDWFLAENVSGLQSANDGKALDRILSEFEACGYRLYTNLYKFEQYGIPQARHRIIIIGIRSDLPVIYRVPSPALYAGRDNTCETALRDIPAWAKNQEITRQSEKVIRRLSYIKPGENAFTANLPDNLKLNVKGATISQIYRRLSYCQPSPTVTTSPAQKATMLCHPKHDRPLSVKECARLQEFPDDWIFAGTMAEQYRQIGNAVPVGLGRAIGQVFLSVADGTAVIETKRLRGTDVHEKLKRAMALGQCERSVKE